MVYYKIPLSNGAFDYPAGCLLCCAYFYSGYMYCKFESVTSVGSGWVAITESEFDVRCPDFPTPAAPAGAMVVTTDGETASQNSQQIYEHVQAGGTAVLVDDGGEFWALDHSYSSEARFGYTDEAGYFSGYMIGNNGAVTSSFTRMLSTSEQSLNEAEQTQARNNIGALAKTAITAIYGVAVTFADGKCTYSNSAIKASSVVIVQRRSGIAGAATTGMFATTSYNGYVTIVADNADVTTANLNIVIFNP